MPKPTSHLALNLASFHMAPQNWGGGAFFLLLALTPPAAQAKNAASVPAVTRIQAQAFGLGYALRAADLQALDYTKSVQTLQDVSDPNLAGAEVAHFRSEVPKLRSAEAASYTQAATLLNRMGAPTTLRDWAVHSAAILNAPLLYPEDARKLAKTEPATALVLAELTEIRVIKSRSDEQQSPMTLWLELIGGKAAPWTADVGAYAAELREGSHAAAPSRLASVTAQVLLRDAPPDVPAAARESLAALIPSGGGNLQNFATIASANVTEAKITHACETLVTLYSAEAEAETLDKGRSG